MTLAQALRYTRRHRLTISYGLTHDSHGQPIPGAPRVALSPPGPYVQWEVAVWGRTLPEAVAAHRERSERDE